MLKTLDSYIEAQAERDRISAALWGRIARDRRFNFLLVTSVICHLIFYAAIIWLNYWEMKQIKPARRAETVLYEIAEIVPQSKGFDIRRAPEPLERADLTRLHYDPNNPDDTQLVSRSPNPTRERGNGGLLPSVQEIERHLQASGNSTGSKPQPFASAQTGSSRAAPAPLDNLPQIDLPVVGQPQPPAMPPAPGTASSIPSPPAISPPVPSGSRRGDSIETTAFGIERTRARYEAYVREKIRRVNERNMPREWIKDILSERASVVFELTLRRGGYIQSLRLFNPSGHRLLDASAREAINIASPFEGFPQNAGDTITITVIVHYYPLR